jgi:hypothetical protein
MKKKTNDKLPQPTPGAGQNKIESKNQGPPASSGAEHLLKAMPPRPEERPVANPEIADGEMVFDFTAVCRIREGSAFRLTAQHTVNRVGHPSVAIDKSVADFAKRTKAAAFSATFELQARAEAEAERTRLAQSDLEERTRAEFKRQLPFMFDRPAPGTPAIESREKPRRRTFQSVDPML